jgi:hypothetical protein
VDTQTSSCLADGKDAMMVYIHDSTIQQCGLCGVATRSSLVDLPTSPRHRRPCEAAGTLINNAVIGMCVRLIEVLWSG